MLQVKNFQTDTVQTLLTVLHPYLMECLGCTEEELVTSSASGGWLITLKADKLTHPVLGMNVTVDLALFKTTTNATNSVRVFFDDEAQFLWIQSTITATGFPATDFYFSKENCPNGCIVAHTEKEDGIFRFMEGTNTPADAYAHTYAPFYLNINVAPNIKSALVYNINEPTTKDMGAYGGNEFDLVPLYIGLAKMKNLYVCANNRTNIGKIVTGSDGTEYICIGNGIFYKL